MIFIFYGGIILISSATSLTFAPIALLLSNTFEVSIIWVDMCSNVYNATFAPMTFLSIYMLNKFESATVIRIACVLFLVGSWIRNLFPYFENKFWFIILGQTLISCSFPFFTSAITLIANKWFTDSEREMAIATFCIAIPAGNLIAFV